MSKKIKFMHIADTHIGYNGNASLYNEFSELKVNKYTETGENIRTIDVNNSFSQSIDIAKEEKVDFVVHSGDGLNTVGYQNPKHYNFYMDQVSRLTDIGKHWIEIAGNHNFSKNVLMGNELFKLEKLSNVRAAYKGKYEKYELPEYNVVFHLLPSSFNNEFFHQELRKVKKEEGKFNILVAHCGVSSIEHYAKSDSSIVVHLEDLISLNMEYVALGDYHYFTDLGNNIIYPGPIERFAFGQEKNPRVIIVEYDPETFEVEKKHRFLDVRPMIDMEPIDAEGMLLEDIQTEIVKRFEQYEVDDALVRLQIKNLAKNLKHRHLFLTDEIRGHIEKCLYFKFDFRNKIELSEGIRLNDKPEKVFEGLLEGLQHFVKTLPEDPNFKESQLVEITSKYLMEVLEDADR